MKRSEALQPLSHQHHNSLMACLLLRKGIDRRADPAILNDFMSRFFREDIEPHFEAEEKYLFPLLQTWNKRLFHILQNDHLLLRNLAERILNGRAGDDFLASFSRLLEGHIRFEERVVFQYVQEHLSPEEEIALQNALHDQKARKCSDYPVKFWE